MTEILREVVPLYGRMIHGRDNGKLWEAPQAYDVHGRVELPVSLVGTNYD